MLVVTNEILAHLELEGGKRGKGKTHSNKYSNVTAAFSFAGDSTNGANHIRLDEP